jgi:nitroreductase
VKERLAETVYAHDNVRTAPLVIAIATEGGESALDVGRAMQNMFLVAWNEGVVSCPNGMPDPAAAAGVLGLDEGLLPVSVPSFGYPKRPRDPESRTAEEWSREANRKPLEEVVRRV